ncbi:PREDICTED: protein indeterminate-domain 9-like, partial [Camelina sativa]|uniref:Protein indeterminate-domain 9-like n=1 Tax=Camelina sativa TaxID=90675 RepID=A0ABM0ZF38_CAMSA
LKWNRKDSFITHRAFCDALAEESARFVSVPPAAASATPAYLHNAPDAEVNLGNINQNHQHGHTTSSQLDQPGFNNQRQTFLGQTFTNQLPIQPNVYASPSTRSASDSLQNLWHLQGQSSHQWLLNENNNNNILQRGISKNEEEHEIKKVATSGSLFSSEALNNANDYSQNGGQIASMSATALLQKAAQMGSKRSSSSLNNSKAFGLMSNTSIFNNKQTENMKTTEVDEGGFTRDFLGVGSQHSTWPLLMVNRNLLDSSPPATTDGTPTPDRNH